MERALKYDKVTPVASPAVRRDDLRIVRRALWQETAHEVRQWANPASTNTPWRDPSGEPRCLR